MARRIDNTRATILSILLCALLGAGLALSPDPRLVPPGTPTRACDFDGRPRACPGLRARVVVESGNAIRSGASPRLHIVLTNISASIFQVVTDEPVIVTFVSATGHEAEFRGTIAGTGVLITLAPGVEGTIAAVARARDRLRGLEPGRYVLTARVPIYGSRDHVWVDVEPHPMRVTPR